MIRSCALTLLALVAACHHDKKVTTMPQPTPAAPAPTAQAKPAPVSTNLAAGDDLVHKCALQVDENKPQFDYNKFELTQQDRQVLQQVATCLTSGPLKGKQLEIVGRADPRGTEEYNMGLGDRRAETVGQYLQKLGVSHVDAKTRGALDATGTDESGWAHDRRVDMSVN